MYHFAHWDREAFHPAVNFPVGDAAGHQGRAAYLPGPLEQEEGRLSS